MRLKNKLTLGFGAALFILVSIGLLSYRRFSKEDVEQHWVEHTHGVLEKLDSTFSALLELNADERGYSLTHQDVYLDSCHRLIGIIKDDLAEIKTLTADNPAQQSAHTRLSKLLEKRIVLLTQLQARTGAGDDIESPRINLTSEVRKVLSDMRAEEEKLLHTRLQEAESGNRQLKIILGIGYVFSLFFFVLTVYAIFAEIEKRTQTEEGLRRAQERYRLLFDRNPIPVWVYDLETLDILDVNETAGNRYGYTREEFLKLKIADLRPREDVSRLLKNISETNEAMQDSGPWRHKKKSGEIIDVQIRSYPLTFGGRNARLVVATDITEQKKAEDALKESEERFRLIVSNIKDYAIVVLDPEGRITSWNGGAEKINGYSKEEILAKHFSLFYSGEDIAAAKPMNELKSAREQGRFEDEGWRVRKDGSCFWANVVVTPFRDDSGTLRGFVKITRDVTERRQAEQEIVRRSLELEAANKELEAFSYSVSHDLRAPLRGIEGFSQALHEDYQQHLDDTAKGYLARIRAATHRMGELIDDLLNLSRVTRAEMYKERIDLSKLASEVAQEFEQLEPKRGVAVKIAQGLQTEGDSRLLRVALQNLIGNAWKFTSKLPAAEIEFGEKVSNGDRAYFVRDNGAGFDQSYASRLFGAFQRLHAANEFPGTGIGLATVQRIIRRHGGTVWAEGFVNRGATIYFTLGRPNA
jgi:PAS domain S-box-containing protein